MATLVLGALGAAIGGSVGGSVLGLSGAVLGRAAGATIGRIVDQSVMGRGAEAVEHGRVDQFRITGASEGASIPRVFGRVRVGGQVIWTTRFKEHRRTSGGGGGKGAPQAPSQTTFTYTLSCAVALCEGEIRRVGRVWADGREVAVDDLNMRVHHGGEDQVPDALMEALDGAGSTPAYRGLAYVVFEDLDLTPFGNRMPQFSFEVVRAADALGEEPDAAECVQGVAVVPGTGEFALSTTAVHFEHGDGVRESANVNTVAGKADFRVALGDMVEELPSLGAAALVVSWFGDDLRAGSCRLRPKVEHGPGVGERRQAWSVSGLTRDTAQVVPQVDGRPVYGGTPTDVSVVQAIRAMTAKGLDVTFYPFILMEQMEGNGLPDPWGGEEQARLPWRGRIRAAAGAGGTQAAVDEVAAFFGTAVAEDFAVAEEVPNERLVMTAPVEESYRRFILHYARLCAHAGGVEAFCIGSEMRGLTQIRGPGNSFPAVEAMRDLAAEVRRILPQARIGYAADWTEYFGYQPGGTGDVFYHLDPLWADPAIDFVGIDNYAPLADWREGPHADEAAGAPHDLGYLRANIEGGEGYDWYYPTPEARAAQRRVPITDGAHGEPWIYRFKDLRNWWARPHYERTGGVRSDLATAWVPGSKPVRFVEYGCAAIDKGANEPNKFLDPKSSESALPRYSTGRRDDAMQAQYIRALTGYYREAANNPVSDVYGGPMLDLAHSFVWAWDARPYPAFPDLRAHWADGENWLRGHWFSGRSASQPVASVIAEICERVGLSAIDVAGLPDVVVRGYAVSGVTTARAALQPLIIAHGIEVSERGGVLRFSSRARADLRDVEPGDMVRAEGAVLEHQRGPDAEVSGRVVVQHVDAGGDFRARVSEAVQPGASAAPVASSELPLALTRGEGVALAERTLAEARLSREAVSFAAAPSRRDLAAGDLVRIGADETTWRIDRIEDRGGRRIEAVRTERQVHVPSDEAEDGGGRARPLAPLPVDATFLDLPLLSGEEVPHAPWVAVAGRPWPGAVAIHSSDRDAGYALARVIEAPSMVGVTETELRAAPAGVWDRGPALRLRLPIGTLASASAQAVLNGANVAAIGSGAPDGWELFQFEVAELVAPAIWELSGRLRGLRGTDAAMPGAWPAGSRVVVLDGGPEQMDLRAAFVGLPRHYRIGPAGLPVDHEAYETSVLALGGGGLRPYAPAHVRVTANGGGRSVTWVRRSRLPVEAWGAGDVPLGEDIEAYGVRFIDGGGAVVEERRVAMPRVELSAGAWADLAAAGVVAVDVAQVSTVQGPGPGRRVALA